MKRLFFITGNDEKFQIARGACERQGLELEQQRLDIDEIQGEDSKVIIRDKAQKAFAKTRQPLVVDDVSWNIPGLRGFPGPYMKSVAHWFTPEDFLNLTRPLKDRRIILVQLLAYQDDAGYQLFRLEHTGTLLPEARGSYGTALHKIITMPGDKGLSVAEAYDRGTIHAERDVAAGWQQLATWLQENRS